MSAGGFDVEGAQAVAKTRDKFATLDLLDALVRKSLVATGQSFGRTRFSMLETIRQFAEDQLVANGEAEESRTATRCFSPARNRCHGARNSPRQREAYTWLTSELSNLRTAFRWLPIAMISMPQPRSPFMPRPLVTGSTARTGTWAGELIQRAEAIGTSDCLSCTLWPPNAA